jgi:hypothetical protein
VGVLARQGLWVVFPHAAGTFDTATLVINVAGCGLIGMLMTAVTEVWHASRLAVSFLGWACWAASRPCPRTSWTSRNHSATRPCGWRKTVPPGWPPSTRPASVIAALGAGYFGMALAQAL